MIREFPPADIFIAQALRTADPQISCVCAQCVRRAAAQVAPDTGPSAHAHSPGSRERSAHTQLAQLLRRCRRLAEAAATGSAQQVTVLRQQGGRRQYAKRLGRGRRRRMCGKNTPTLLLPRPVLQFRTVENCQPSNPTNFGLVFQVRTLRVFGDLMSNISATRGRPDMRFCVCGSPSEDLSHIASLTIGCSR